ncbi:DUF6250 domain-containing protein [Seonamhaeicola sp. MEBiC1930]|uniref:DUF6250 domain-containing protein n=1 Tax=Seonamhaeicola sp. MEBiC01930 TaxID=2976768 RepID=UPI00324BB847
MKMQNMFYRFKSIIILFSITIIFSCNDEKTFTINDELIKAALIYEEDFNDNLEDWKVEQMDGGRAVINKGKLEITDVSGCTIWLMKEFEGPIMIEYDVFVIDEGGPQDRVSDLNCFWMAKDPKNMNDLFARSDERGGKFSNYDSLRLYYMGVGGHFNTKTRFRRYVGNGERPLLPEHDLSEQQYLLTANQPYHIKIISYNGHIQYYRNDQLITDFYDKNPYVSGHFGFRTVNNHMTVDNFKVYKLISE